MECLYIGVAKIEEGRGQEAEGRRQEEYYPLAFFISR
jgi:hypothetical protein